jgi:hypothetical protein
MEKEMRKNILLIFVGLCIATALVLLIKLRYPYIFPGVEQRLFIFTTILGVASLILYLQDLSNLLKSRFLKNILTKKLKKEERKHKKEKELELKKFAQSFSLSIKALASYPKKNPLKFSLIIIAIFSYIYFLFWLYPKLSFDEFAFFLLLLYIPISLKLKLDERYPIAVAIFLLILSAITLAQGFEEKANLIAIYAYYFLVIGVSLLFIDFLRNKEKYEKEDYE